jgi:hypothetical protein
MGKEHSFCKKKRRRKLESCNELCSSAGASVVTLLYAWMDGSHEEPTPSSML